MNNLRLNSAAARPRPTAFTLVELLVVIAIIGVLIAASLPAVQASRELARRTLCTSRLAGLLTAIDGYEAVHGRLPPGSISAEPPHAPELIARNHNWISQILPNLDESNRHRRIDFSKSVDDPSNAEALAAGWESLRCPSASEMRLAASNYAGCHHDVAAPIAADNHGVLFLDSQIRYRDISDGRAYTIFLGEKLDDADDALWMSGSRATLRNTGLWQPSNRFRDETLQAQRDAAPEPARYVGGFDSAHTGGNFGFGDGRVQSISRDIDQRLFQQLGHRSDGALVPWPIE